MKFVGTLTLLMLLGIGTALAVPLSVVPVTESTTAAITNTNVRALLEENHEAPVDLGQHPEFRPFMDRIQNLLLRNLQAEGASHQYNFVLIDDMSVNAGFVMHPNGERTILVNLGLLHFVQNDDELVFVLGHEFNHGASQIQEYVEQLHSEGERALAHAMQRSVENEVDTRSLLRWLHDRGYNPHAARHFIERLRVRFSSGPSHSHTMESSRNDTLNLAIVGLSRGGGQAVKADEPSQYSRNIIGPIQERYLHSPQQAFTEHQLARVQELMSALATGEDAHNIEAAYQFVKGGTGPPAEMPQYHEILRNHLGRMNSLVGSDLISAEDLTNLELELTRRLDGVFESARSRNIPLGFVPPDAGRLQALLDLDNRQYLDRSADLINTRHSLQLHQAEVERLQALGASTAQNQSLLTTARAELQTAQRKYEAELLYFEGPRADIESALQTIIRHKVAASDLHYHLSERSSDPFLASMSEAQHNAAVQRLTNQLSRQHARVLGPLIPLREERLAHLRNNSVSVIIDGLRRGQHEDAKLYFSLPEATRMRRDFLRQAFKQAAAGTIDQLRKNEGSLQVQRKDLGRQWEGGLFKGPLTRIFNSYLETDRQAAIQDFQTYARELIPLAAERGLLSNVLVVGHPSEREAVSMMGAAGELQLNAPGLAHEVFSDPSLYEFYHQNYRAMLTRELSVPIPPRVGDFDEVARTHGQGLRSALATYLIREADLRAALGASARDHSIHVSDPLFMTAVRSFAGTLFHGLNPPLTQIQARTVLAVELGIPPHSRAELQNFRAAFRELGQHPQAGSILHRHFLAENVRSALYPRAESSEFYNELLRASRIMNFSRHEAGVTTRLGDTIAETKQFALWVEQNHPERLDVLAPTLTLSIYGGLREFSDNAARMFTPILRQLQSQFAHLPPAQRAEAIARNLWAQTKNWNLNTAERAQTLQAFAQEKNFTNLQERANYLNAFVELLEHGGLTTQEVTEFKESRAMSNFMHVLNRALTNAMNPKATGRDVTVLSPAEFARFTVSVIRNTTPSAENDRLFERAWELSRNDAEARRHLNDETLISHLFYDENRRTLASWQLENKFNLKNELTQIRRGHNPIPNMVQVRPNVLEAYHFIERQFPDPSAVKNEMLDLVQRSLVTTPAETHLLDQGRMNLENWHQSRNLAALDAPHLANDHISNNLDRIEMIQYLNGMQEEIPEFIRNLKTGSENRAEVINGLKTARRQFAAADPVTRSYVMQPLLGSEKGILDDPHAFEILKDRILGEHAHDPVFRALFDSYLNSLTAHSPSERQVILGHMLGTFADRSAESRSGSLSVRSVLEAMGPFGVKAGQFLRSSGMITPALRRDLDHLFDNALPPSRGEIFRRLRAVFGDNLPNIESVRQLVGSGSLNYVVLVDFREPHTNQSRRAVVRFSRSTTEDFRDINGNLIGDSLWQRVDVGGQIEHENKIWQGAITELLASPHQRVSRIGHGLEEARAHSMSTLGREGPELNLSFERGVYPEVAASYNSSRHPTTGFTVEVVPPNAQLQALVPERFSNAVSVYEYVEHTQLSEIHPPALREGLARQIIDAEMRALLHNGIYDADGHRGNWLIDVANRRLRRIDYSQKQSISQASRNAIRQNLTLLLTPSFGRAEIQALAQAMPSLFQFDGNIPHLEQHLRTIVRSEDFPHFSSPQERLLYLHEKLEEAVSAETGTAFTLRLQTEMRGAINSLLRVAVFREQAGDRALGESLLEHLGLDRMPFARAYARQEIASQTRRALSLVSERWTATRELISKKFHWPTRGLASASTNAALGTNSATHTPGAGSHLASGTDCIRESLSRQSRPPR